MGAKGQWKSTRAQRSPNHGLTHSSSNHPASSLSPELQSKFYGKGAGECASEQNIHAKHRTFLREKGSRTW